MTCIYCGAGPERRADSGECADCGAFPEPYAWLCEHLDEELLLQQPWAMGSWHPQGAHFWSLDGSGVNIVVTDWSDNATYDVGVYLDRDMDDMVPLECWAVPVGQSAVFVAGLLACGPGRWADAPELDSVPFAPEVVAAAYIAQVRANGPEFMANVAGVDQDRRGLVSPFGDVVYECMDTLVGLYGEQPDDSYERRWECCTVAAKFAVAVFSAELDGGRSS